MKKKSPQALRNTLIIISIFSVAIFSVMSNSINELPSSFSLGMILIAVIVIIGMSAYLLEKFLK